MTVEACPACAAALINPHAAMYTNGCLGCQVRHISHGPKFIRDAYYARINDTEEAEAFRTAVGLEYARRVKMLKGAK